MINKNSNNPLPQNSEEAMLILRAKFKKDLPQLASQCEERAERDLTIYAAGYAAGGLKAASLMASELGFGGGMDDFTGLLEETGGDYYKAVSLAKERGLI